MNSKLLRGLSAVGLSGVCLLLIASPVLAIALPSSTPSIIEKNIYRNVLETGDMLFLIHENTPYSATPNMTYSQAFIWRLIDTDGTTELAQAVGSNYNESGYGYNLISFYLDAGNVTALGIAWEDNLFLTLSGTPVAFADPPKYTYSIGASSYSPLTVSSDVKAAIAARILSLASEFNTEWALSTTYYLTTEAEAGTVLSLFGQTFFREAVYGLQSMAPAAFPVIITPIEVADRTWSTDYITTLEDQYTGTYMEDAITAGKDFFNVSYNLMGMLGTALLCVVIIFAHWYLSGGNMWKGLMESAAPVVICTRLAMFGLGELGLLAAVCWLYISAKVWKVI